MLVKTLRIGAPRVTQEAGGSRLDVEVCGEPLFVRANVPLAESSEALVAAFYLVAQHYNAVLRIEGELDPIFLQNVPAVAAFAERHLRLPGCPVQARSKSDRTKQAGASAAFLTEGLESLYTLARRTAELDALIHVAGLDKPGRDSAAAERHLQNLRRLTEASGQFLIEMETNLRDLRLFRSVDWEITRSAALAAMAQCLAGQVGHILVPLSDVGTFGGSLPWGAHPLLIEGWSSSAVEIVCDTSPANWIDKIAALGNYPPALDYLQVCGRGEEPGSTFGEREICVRAVAALHIVGGLSAGRTLPQDTLFESIRALPPLTPQQRRAWQALLDHPRSGDLAAVIKNKLEETPLAPALTSASMVSAASAISASRLTWQIRNFRLVGQMLR
ncbi:unnamed protein product [Symbiodinium necroappetens]|uniref:Uncharacterized protein n=1 Tax=Symbiodinium necroappetens TaxID=1628268 RepID=A0A813B6T7_9DINO|nr:unnamed protein product [Symbiodinium necroappetens]